MGYEGPVPTKLVALSDICSVAVGDKVRFLGCVVSYHTATGRLTLQHNYPVGSYHRVLVDVELVLDNLSSTDTSVGEWVNVMGYVTRPPTENVVQSASSDGKVSYVQAILLWSAGSIDLAKYESILTGQLTG